MATTRPSDTFDGDVAVVGELLELVQQFGVCQRHEGFSRLDECLAIHLLDQIDQLSAAGPIVQRVPDPILGHQDRIERTHDRVNLSTIQWRKCLCMSTTCFFESPFHHLQSFFWRSDVRKGSDRTHAQVETLGGGSYCWP